MDAKHAPPPQPAADDTDAAAAPPAADPSRLQTLLDYLAWERVQMSRFGLAPAARRPIGDRFATLVRRLRPTSPASARERAQRDYARAVEMAAAHRRAMDEALAGIARSLGLPTP